MEWYKVMNISPSTTTLLAGTLCCLLALWLRLPADDSAPTQPALEAGAHIQDVTPPFDSLLINGGFTERRRGKMNPGDLKARCFVLRRDQTLIAIAVVDSCMIPRDVCDRAKQLTFKATGIPTENILITSTHTHTAPSTMDYCLGTMADPAYTNFLPPKISEGITNAFKKIQPARIGWFQIPAKGLTHNRRWITRPDKMQTDPFGETTVRAMMHPGYQNPNYIGPSGPIDDDLSLISIESLDGKPLAVLANYSMHYYGGCGPADYFGMYSDRLAEKLTRDGQAPVCAMTQGTSGDLHWMNYKIPRNIRDASKYTNDLIALTQTALKDLPHHDSPPLAMDQKSLTLKRRLPDQKRLAWADQLLTEMKGRRPKTRPEVYAEQARYLHENPSEEILLQTLRIGDLALTALPNEVYAITGLKLKARSPFETTINLELSNGASGYIPPPEQHALGGYNTWPARTAGLEVQAEPKIVEALLSSLESLSEKSRRQAALHHGDYPKAILTKKPLAYWRCDDLDGALRDSSPHNLPGKITGTVAYYLDGPDSPAFSGDLSNHALQLAGGNVSATVPNARSLSFFFWNGMDQSVRDNTGDLVLLDDTFHLRIGGKADGKHAGHLILKSGDKITHGGTNLTLRHWHHLSLSIDKSHLHLFLDGQLELKLPRPKILSTNWTLGGPLPIEGRLDEVAWLPTPLTINDAKQLYTFSKLTPPPKPLPPRPKQDRGSTKNYSQTILASKPTAYRPLKPPTNNFTGKRFPANVPNIGDTYSVSFWFRNSLPNSKRPVTAYLFSRGIDGLKSADGDHLGIGGTHAAAGHLIVYNGNTQQKLLTGKTVLEPGSWHHLTMIRQGQRIRVFLNGHPKPEIDASLPRTYPDTHPQFFFGGRSDNFANLQGHLDHAALFNRALTPGEISTHYRTVKLTPAPLPTKTEISKPLSPADSLKAIHVPDGYEVQLVASEPLVQDPVAIDWSPNGQLWVAEMADYPSGIDGKPGGRVRLLTDSDGDGVFDKSSLFLKDLNFPAGIMSWRKGVLIAAAPDIIYAEDSTGDGKADIKKVLFTGFKQGNQQLRVNGLSWGLDNHVHGANGSHHSGYAAGIKITSPVSQKTFSLGSFDFRMQPDEGLLEPLSGPSQFGRTRDDWGNSFGVQNSFPLWHYVLEQRYLARNPDFAAPDPRRQLRPRNPPVFQATPAQKRFHSFNNSGHFTSACSPMIYRDDLLFPDKEIHAFTCEPFHNLVQHMILKRDGYSFTAKRAEADGPLDFFASKDRWSRPVMARTGPDGALWIVDMYRYMIEHPEWLPKEGRSEMQEHERKGSAHGRIYRVFPKNKKLQPFPRLDRASPAQLVAQLAHSNGVIRDLAHRLLVEKQAVFVTDSLIELAQKHSSPKTRLHALCILDGIDRLSPTLLKSALSDPHPQIKRNALRLAESRWKKHPGLLTTSLKLTNDSDPAVRLQAACSLGLSNSPAAGKALARLVVRDHTLPFIRAAVFSSTHLHFDHLAEAALENGVLIEELLKLGGKQKSLDPLITRLATPGENGFTSNQFKALGSWLDHHPKAVSKLDQALTAARKVAPDQTSSIPLRVAAVSLLGRHPSDQALLENLLTSKTPSPLKCASIDALARLAPSNLSKSLLQNWATHSVQERTRILDILLRRPAWTQACLEAFKSGTISLTALDASRRQLLLTHSDPAIQRQATQLLKDPSKQPASFRPALKLKGDKAAGRKVFDQLCAVCHLPPKGLPVNGPDLRSITDRSKEGLFISILDPNQSIDPTYESHTITLPDDTTLFGRILSENQTHLTLRQLDGSDRQLSRKTLKSLKKSGRSLMPEGLGSAMSHQDLANLISFLQGFGSQSN